MSRKHKGQQSSAHSKRSASLAELREALRRRDMVLHHLLFWARHERDGGACAGCDPGNEGAEIWGDLAVEIENALQIASDKRRRPSDSAAPETEG